MVLARVIELRYAFPHLAFFHAYPFPIDNQTITGKRIEQLSSLETSLYRRLNHLQIRFVITSPILIESWLLYILGKWCADRTYDLKHHSPETVSHKNSCFDGFLAVRLSSYTNLSINERSRHSFLEWHPLKRINQKRRISAASSLVWSRRVFNSVLLYNFTRIRAFGSFNWLINRRPDHYKKPTVE